jgi:hypothetical protein
VREPSVTGSTLALRGVVDDAEDSRSRRSCQQCRFAELARISLNRQTRMHGPLDLEFRSLVRGEKREVRSGLPCALRRRRAALAVASRLQKVVEVAVFHALEE